jgi:4-amino-4-deoxy-L-arabinose transferase-like glycosyltransferase
MRLAFALVAAAALLSLAMHSARVGLAGDYVDPVGRITAQDEALYANTSIHMARDGGWLTPMFMGRYAFYKPPLLYWVSAAAARCIGIFTFSLRLPVALLAALAAGLLFLWAAEIGGWPAGVLCLALLVSNHLWHVLSGLALTDGLLAAFFIGAFYALFSDPWLESKAGLWGFCGCVAAVLLTKGIAGLLPLGVLAVYWVVAPRRYRARPARVAGAAFLAVALAAPWFIYQLATHGKWFRTEHVNVEILGFGAGAPPQTSSENPAAFYVMRLALTDPMLLAAFVVAVPGTIAALRRRDPGAILLACWLAIGAAAILGWQYRNAAYLLPIVPALALAAGAYGPLAYRASSKAVVGLALALVLSKAATAGAPWGMSFAAGSFQPLASTLQDYCERARPAELIVAGMDDDLYASALPLYRLRYALVGGASPGSSPYAMDFAGMGIVATADQFNHLAQWMPAFRTRLHEWGLDSTAPVATLIRISNESELAETVRAHPESDFLLPDRYRGAADAAHITVEAFPAHVFLLSRTVDRGGAPPPWTCRM